MGKSTINGHFPWQNVSSPEGRCFFCRRPSQVPTARWASLKWFNWIIHGHRRGQVDVNRSLFNSTGNGAPMVDPIRQRSLRFSGHQMGKWSPAAWGPLKSIENVTKRWRMISNLPWGTSTVKHPLIRIDCNDLTVTSLEWWLGEMAWFDLFLGQWIIAIQTDFQSLPASAGHVWMVHRRMNHFHLNLSKPPHVLQLNIMKLIIFASKLHFFERK